MAEYKDIKTPKGMDTRVVWPDVKFQAPDKKYPMIIFLHGIQERYDEGGRFPAAVCKYGPVGQTLHATNPIQLPFFCVGPHLRSGDWTKEQVNDVTDTVLEQFPIDPNRLIIMGASLGGRGLMSVISDPPTCARFAAFVAMCPGPRMSSFNAANIAADGIPGWIAHALNDDVVPQSVGLAYLNDINKAAGGPRVRFSEAGLYGHGCWNQFLKEPQGVYRWLELCTLQNKIKPVDQLDYLTLKNQIIAFVQGL